MRIVFMGTPEFAVPILQRLIASNHEVLAAVSQPDRRAGRGQHLQPTPVKQCASEQGVPVLQPESIRTSEFEQEIRELQPDCIAVAAYGKILPKNILELPRYGCVNVHGSLLPKYRGAAPVNWAIINGERRTGVTIMQMDEGLDTGGMIMKREIDILDDDDTLSVSNMLSCLGAEALVEALNRIAETGRVDAEPQNGDEATYAPLLKKEDGRINWKKSPDAIICHILGMQPWPGAFSESKGEVFKFLKAISFYPEEAQTFLNDKQKPGEVIELAPDRGPIVRTGDSCICITQLQPPNRKAISGSDAINGGYVKAGMRFE
ncbi:methionyl-tRNA formyltransferase [Candidatus Sumerlaeota bacterium]|nr:methionyl-tRNA formyltransferase [Candidatus Sumerlaeota bacterium]